MIKETNPMRDDKGGNPISGKPLSPKHGIASPYPMILSWNIFLDIRALSFEVVMKSPSSTRTGVQLLIGMFSFYWRNNNKNATVDTRPREFGVSRHILSGIRDE